MPAKAYGGAKPKVLNPRFFWGFFCLGRPLLGTNVFHLALLSWLVHFWGGCWDRVLDHGFYISMKDDVQEGHG